MPNCGKTAEEAVNALSIDNFFILYSPSTSFPEAVLHFISSPSFTYNN